MTDSEGNEIGKLFVGGLSQATNNASLRIYFSRFGEVDDAVVMMDNKTGRSRGFGYVKYREPDSVSLALEAKPHVLDGKEVDAKQCNINMKGRNRRSLKIFVGGIGLDQDAESIKNFFRQFGRVTDVNLMMDSNKQRHRGFAFVGFEDESVVKRLIGLHYVIMNTKQVEIKAMEPPNFGRKIGPNACLTTGAIMNGANGAVEGQGFENSPDVSSMLAASPFVNSVPYISSQTPGITCMPANMLNPTRSLYDQAQGGFNATLESLYPSTGFIQSGTKSTDNLQSAGTYLGPKQSVPLVLASGQYPASAINQNVSSLCHSIPYQLLSPTYIPATQQHPNTIGKTSWHLATVPPQCTSNPLPQTSSLLSCPAFAPTQTPGLSNHQSTDMATPMGSILTPYYTLCPQYAAISVPGEQAMPYPITHPNSMIGTAMTTAANDVNGTGSKSPSSACETGGGGSVQKPVYPAIMMAPSAGVPNPTTSSVVAQSLWNPSQSNFFYSPLSMGWTVPQAGGQQFPHSWTSPLGVVPPPVQPPAAFDPAKDVTLNAGVEEVQLKEIGMKPEMGKPVQTQASGDGMDNVVTSNQGPINASPTPSYNYMKNITGKTVTSKTGQPVEKAGWQDKGTSALSSNSWSGTIGYWNEMNSIPVQTWPTSAGTIEDRVGDRKSRGDYSPDDKRMMTSNSAAVKQATLDPRTVERTQDNVVGNNTSAQRQTDQTSMLPSSNTARTRTGHGSQPAQDESTTRTLVRNCDTDYTSWVYRKTGGTCNLVEKNPDVKKELQTTPGMELECQGPAGAAGDFHHPVHAPPYSSYHLAH